MFGHKVNSVTKCAKILWAIDQLNRLQNTFIHFHRDAFGEVLNR